jgi:hypothetical protein
MSYTVNVFTGCLDNPIVISDDENADPGPGPVFSKHLRASSVTFTHLVDNGSDNSVESRQSSSVPVLPNPFCGKQTISVTKSLNRYMTALDFRRYSESELLVWLASFDSPARSEYAFSEIYGDMGKGSRAPSVGGNGGSSMTAMSPFPRSFSGADASGNHTSSDDVFPPVFGTSGVSSNSTRIRAYLQ